MSASVSVSLLLRYLRFFTILAVYSLPQYRMRSAGDEYSSTTVPTSHRMYLIEFFGCASADRAAENNRPLYFLVFLTVVCGKICLPVLCLDHLVSSSQALTLLGSSAIVCFAKTICLLGVQSSYVVDSETKADRAIEWRRRPAKGTEIIVKQRLERLTHRCRRCRCRRCCSECPVSFSDFFGGRGDGGCVFGGL